MERGNNGEERSKEEGMNVELKGSLYAHIMFALQIQTRDML